MTITLASQATIDARHIALLELENITDPLTGIYNRRYLDKRLEEETVRARRYGLPLSGLVVDIDHFKDVNDKFGHQIGDIVLHHLCQLIIETCRKSDIIARYGGEEIFIIAINTEIYTANTLAGRIRKKVRDDPFAFKMGLGKSQHLDLTVSIGVSTLSRTVTEGHEMIKTADAALYSAKQCGRDCTSSHTSSKEPSLRR